MNILRLTQRFIVISALGLWLGGFTVYAAFVIRIGHRMIPGGRFGFVTAEVTSVLDVLAAIAAVAVTVHLVANRRALAGGLKWTSLADWLVLVLSLAAAFILHARLDALLDFKSHDISDQTRFQTLHEAYEMAATVQWGAGLLGLWCALAAWRRQDAAAASPPARQTGP
jgi:hypothetical protein